MNVEDVAFGVIEDEGPEVVREPELPQGDEEDGIEPIEPEEDENVVYDDPEGEGTE